MGLWFYLNAAFNNLQIYCFCSKIKICLNNSDILIVWYVIAGFDLVGFVQNLLPALNCRAFFTISHMFRLQCEGQSEQTKRLYIYVIPTRPTWKRRHIWGIGGRNASGHKAWMELHACQPNCSSSGATLSNNFGGDPTPTTTKPLDMSGPNRCGQKKNAPNSKFESIHLDCWIGDFLQISYHDTKLWSVRRRSQHILWRRWKFRRMHESRTSKN